MNCYHLLDNLPSCNLYIHRRHSNGNFFLRGKHKVRDNFRSIFNYLSMVMVMVMILVMVMVMILVMVMVRVRVRVRV